MFIGRKAELEFLESRYRRKGGQLIVIYGRRRIGKTELIHEFCRYKKHVFYACRECTDTEQLAAFSNKMLKNIVLSNYIQAFQDWERGFSSILEQPGSGKKLLVIDEFPHMVHGNKSIPSILQNLWDSKLKNENIMIILCGSAMSFIEKEVLAEKNPLYGRATGILKVNEMSFSDAAAFFPGYPLESKVLAYSILGGVPHYLKQFDDSLSVDDNITENILTRGSILYSEVEFMMRQELRETSVYNSIIAAIAMGNTKLNDIYQKTLIERAKISVYIKNLMDLNIVEREFSVDTAIKSSANVQRGLYNIKDNYFKFWYRFVYPYLSELEIGDVEGVFTHSVKPYLNEFTSKPFENICIQYMRNLNIQGKLPRRFKKIGRWWYKDQEIDIVAFDDKGIYILGECKWTNEKIGLNEFSLLKSKASFLRGKEYYYYMFSKSGFTHSLKALAKEEPNVRLVDLRNLVPVPF